MTTIKNGWLSTAKSSPSPNFNTRPQGITPRLIVIHNISLPPSQFGDDYIEQFFHNKLDPNAHPYFKDIHTLEVSAHLLIKRTGAIIQFVSFDDRAWHAGKSCYLGVDACNDYSIGIELEGDDVSSFSAAQYQALSDAINAIHCAYPLTQNHLTGHSDIAPGRKTDPGEGFEWQRIRNMIKR